MRTVRNLLASLGFAVLCLALVVAFVPAAGTAVPVSGAVEWFGSEYLLVGAVGAAALALVLTVLVAWLVSGVDRTEPPEPERVPTGQRFGAEFDRLVADDRRLRTRPFLPRNRVRERLREAAVRTVMRASGCSRSAARRRVDGGTWTGDREAAAFLGGEDGPSVSRRARIAAVLRAEAWSRRGARRAAAEIVRYADAEERE